MADLNIAVIVKLEPDFSEGNVSYNADGTLNRAETKSILGPHSAVASSAAFYATASGATARALTGCIAAASSKITSRFINGPANPARVVEPRSNGSLSGNAAHIFARAAKG